MPRGGHNRLPTRVKVIRGTNRPDRANPDEPKPGSVDKVSPVLPIEGHALEVFESLAAQVAGMGILHEEHAHKLTLAAVAYAGAWAAHLDGDPGLFVRLSMEFRQLTAGYGLDPASMTKVSAKKDGGGEDPVLKLLKDRIG